MSGRLEGEVAIVTGAAQGLGAAISDVLEAEGARVARTGRRGADVHLDVRDRASVERAVEEIASTIGQPTVLVNNAGLNRIDRAEDLSEEAWQEVLDVDLTGPFRCTQIVGRRMLEAGRGAVVNVGSILATVGAPGRVAYASAKSGLIGMTRVFAIEWASRGVRVNAVCPGFTRTPMLEQALEKGFHSEAAIRARTPGGRLVEPSEAAAAVAFLASRDATFITGQTLVVDGGFLVYGAPSPATEETAETDKEVPWSSA